VSAAHLASSSDTRALEVGIRSDRVGETREPVAFGDRERKVDEPSPPDTEVSFDGC
jgi:hypothetical protein